MDVYGFQEVRETVIITIQGHSLAKKDEGEEVCQDKKEEILFLGYSGDENKDKVLKGLVKGLKVFFLEEIHTLDGVVLN